MNVRFTTWLLILSNFGLASCSGQHESTAAPPLNRALRPAVSFQRTQEERVGLIAATSKVKIGASADEVIALMGSPTFDKVVGPKVERLDNQAKFHRVLSYALTQYGVGPNEWDEMIGFTFDRKGKNLAEIYLSNVSNFHDDSFSCKERQGMRECIKK
ncbi:MAG TPA: hypothetical protein VEW69_12670 [Alphaproteobacteria bacterium]|nr:hypothetical protein [Alphaproteobacteria bacterium]